MAEEAWYELRWNQRQICPGGQNRASEGCTVYVWCHTSGTGASNLPREPGGLVANSLVQKAHPSENPNSVLIPWKPRLSLGGCENQMFLADTADLHVVLGYPFAPRPKSPPTPCERLPLVPLAAAPLSSQLSAYRDKTEHKQALEGPGIQGPAASENLLDQRVWVFVVRK